MISINLFFHCLNRRIRTRLYFTSESHLHTLLNVLRFSSPDSSLKEESPLSTKGKDIISMAPELCYLTQIVIRLFENTSKEVDDPKRFRIEIFFSPGATATPLHMSELDRNADTTRFDTEPLQLVSKPYLTCKELEDYLNEAIKEGTSGEMKLDDVNDHTIIGNESSINKYGHKYNTCTDPTAALSSVPSQVNVALNNKENNGEKFMAISEEKKIHITFATNDSAHSSLGEDHPSELKNESRNVSNEDDGNKNDKDSNVDHNKNVSETEILTLSSDNDHNNHDDGQVKAMAVILAKQYFWTSVAAFSFFLGIGCLVLSRETIQSDFKTRRWSRRL